MMMFGAQSGSIPFESHLEKLKEPCRTVLVDLRKFVMSLGSNVIEEVRPHRIVYAKTMNLRTFLDVEPMAKDSLILSIRYGREMPSITMTVTNTEDAERAKKQISEAYQKIR
jgi:hypothetical protein